MFKVQSETRAEMTSLVEELVGNEHLVRAFGYERRAEERFDKINLDLQKCGVKATFFSSTTNPCTRFVNALVYAAVGVLGAFVAIAGGITVGQLSVFLNYANQYTKPFNDISDVMTELQNALACAQRVFDLIDETPIVPDGPDAVACPRRGQRGVDHVRFRYLDDVPLIEDMNLKVAPGQRIALVGPTGCGKTTLVNLLMRFYEINGGTLRVDGYSIDNVTRDSLRGNLGMVLQETWLKAGTIAENIAYGKPDATREEIIAAARRRTPIALSAACPTGTTSAKSEFRRCAVTSGRCCRTCSFSRARSAATSSCGRRASPTRRSYKSAAMSTPTSSLTSWTTVWTRRSASVGTTSPPGSASC